MDISSVLKNLSLCILFFTIGIISVMFYTENDDTKSRIEYTQFVEKKSAADAMNDLYVASDGDIQSLARILQTTPSVINRIRQRETTPTLNFEERFKEVLVYYNINGRSFSKLQSALDDEYGWYDSVLNSPNHHPWLFWGINIALILIWAFVELRAIFPILVELLVFLIAWIAMLICSPGEMEDKYTDSINPIIEQIL